MNVFIEKFENSLCSGWLSEEYLLINHYCTAAYKMYLIGGVKKQDKNTI